MTQNSNKKKSKLGIILWILGVLYIAAYFYTDGNPKELFYEVFPPKTPAYTETVSQGPGSSDNLVNATSTPYLPDEERLPNIPADLYSHVYLTSRERGSCHKLTGEVVITVIFVNDTETFWTEAETQEVKTDCEEMRLRILADASTFGVDLDLRCEYLIASTDVIHVRDDHKEWVDSALASLGLPGTAEANAELKEDYGADEAPIVFFTNRVGRSFARSASTAIGGEYAVIYGDADPFYHELSHIFGAEDFYFPNDVRLLAEEYIPDSIMLNSDNGVMDSFTAYLIGWTDVMDDTALAFLNETSYLTFEYLKAEKEKDSFTGYGTREYTTATYTGDLVDGFAQGFGTMQWHNGNVYQGEWYNNHRHGTGTMTWADGDSYTGDWLEDRREGYGVYTWANGDRYEGSFVNGVRSGQGTLHWISGAVYVGQWLDGVRSGYGTMTYDNGNVYTGNWSNGKRNGEGSLAYINGNSYTGEWRDDTFNGYGTFKWAEGDSYQGQFANGKRNGYGVYRWANGAVYEGEWLDGEKHGQGTMTYSNGTVKSGTWQNGDFAG